MTSHNFLQASSCFCLSVSFSAESVAKLWLFMMKAKSERMMMSPMWYYLTWFSGILAFNSIASSLTISSSIYCFILCVSILIYSVFLNILLSKILKKSSTIETSNSTDWDSLMKCQLLMFIIFLASSTSVKPSVSNVLCALYKFWTSWLWVLSWATDAETERVFGRLVVESIKSDLPSFSSSSLSSRTRSAFVMWSLPSPFLSN